MTEGFVIDAGDSNMADVAHWHEGAPDKRWYGYKVDKTKKRAIVSYRCDRCGLLENYAR